jgi:hypothetical protein
MEHFSAGEFVRLHVEDPEPPRWNVEVGCAVPTQLVEVTDSLQTTRMAADSAGSNDMAGEV